MTHTLHRRGNAGDLREDYVMLVMQSRGINREGNEEKMGEVWDIFSHYETDLTNFGNITDGNSHTSNLDTLKGANHGMAHAVFKDRDTLKACLKEFKEKDLGISVVISGLYEDTAGICSELGMSTHTVEHSLGIHGKTEKLPEDNVLEITTMCGHAMVSPNLVIDLVNDIKAERTTYDEAAEELSRLCDCGIFNPHRAKKVLKKIIAGL